MVTYGEMLMCFLSTLDIGGSIKVLFKGRQISLLFYIHNNIVNFYCHYYLKYV